MNKDELFLTNRIKELARISYDRNIYTYSDFLNINELSIFNQIKNTLPPVNIDVTGGNNYAERKILVFSPQEIYYTEHIPISVLHIAPINSKFSDTLSHRDYLGAILNLGINRSKIGDIFTKEKDAYVYCKEDIADYIIDNLFKIKHTQIEINLSDSTDLEIVPNLREVMGTISNVRLDSLIATAFKATRNSIIPLIEEKKVFINGKSTTSNGATVKEGDIVSVRGKGRFIYDGVLKETKKGRYLIKIRVYE